jgi:hypothetical protein
MAMMDAMPVPKGASRRAARRSFAVISIIEGANHYWNPCNWTLPTQFPKYNSVGVRMYPDAISGAYWTAYEFAVANPRWHDFCISLLTERNRKPALLAMAEQYSSWNGKDVTDNLDYFMSISVTAAIVRLNTRMVG